jgi:hypothetical protein
MELVDSPEIGGTRPERQPIPSGQERLDRPPQVAVPVMPPRGGVPPLASRRYPWHDLPPFIAIRHSAASRPSSVRPTRCSIMQYVPLGKSGLIVSRICLGGNAWGAKGRRAWAAFDEVALDEDARAEDVSRFRNDDDDDDDGGAAALSGLGGRPRRRGAPASAARGAFSAFRAAQFRAALLKAGRPPTTAALPLPPRSASSKPTGAAAASSAATAAAAASRSAKGMPGAGDAQVDVGCGGGGGAVGGGGGLAGGLPSPGQPPFPPPPAPLPATIAARRDRRASPRESRDRHTTSITSPTARTSDGRPTRPAASSDTWTRPV